MASVRAAKAYCCEVDAEPLERYRKGGYHPTHLGDKLDKGRYHILHKLGWGGYSTVWLAIDTKLERHAAIKILVSELSQETQELTVLHLLAQGPAEHPGRQHVAQLWDHFEHTGPNGTHLCLVSEPLGPSVAVEAESYPSGRLPGRSAWRISRQAAMAVDYIHASGVAHGDLHPGNVALVRTNPPCKTDQAFLQSLGQPDRGDVLTRYGHQLTPHLPKYLVAPASTPMSHQDLQSCNVKIIDFGHSFRHGEHREVHTPLVFRAPEVILSSYWDHKVDVWSLGCTLFEILVGYPPFDSILPSKRGLIREWIAMFGDLPKEWRQEADRIIGKDETPLTPVTLADWLHETYFDEDKKAYLTEADIKAAGEVIHAAMQYRPSERPQVSELLEHPWFLRAPSSKAHPQKLRHPHSTAGQLGEAPPTRGFIGRALSG